MEYSYTPYQKKSKKEKKKLKLPKLRLPSSFKLWIAGLVGILVLIGILFILSLGELKFFAVRYLPLTFFSKNYLVVMQNDYELRPGGGFVTAYGNIDFVMGIPTNVSFHNSYDIDTNTYVTPPYPHEDLLKNEWYEGYTFRDANWNPDGPQAINELIGFYQQKFPSKEVDGVIVMNFSLIEDLVDALGGVDLNGKRLTKQNLFSELEFEVNNIDRHNVEALKNRKNVLGDLANVLKREVKRHPYKTKRVLIDGLHNKNLYIWMAKEGMQQKLIEKGWANKLSPRERSDFLAVNLANLGSKKADRYLQTETNYYANITKEVPEVITEVTLRYPGFTNNYSDNYKGYLRIYIPKDADVTSVPVDSVEEIEGEFKVIGTKVIVPAGSKSSLSYIYTLPRNTFVLDQYQLRLAKQSGSEMNYKVTIETPEGSLIESEEFVARENRASFTGKLTNDIDFSLGILPDTTPPYPIEQEFEELNKINVIWNEPLDEGSVQDATNFALTDLNKNAPEVTDEVTVVYAELVEPNILQLETEGITTQTLEHYKLKMLNVRDQSGNLILSNPKDITVVQRIGGKRTEEELEIGEIPEVDPGTNAPESVGAPALAQ